MCVCVSSWVCRINLHLQVPLRINTHTQGAAAPSAFDMGELNDRGAKGKAPPTTTTLSSIDVPYGDLWTDFQISSRSGTQSIRRQDTVLYALTSVMWPGGWNATSQDIHAHIHVHEMRTIVFPVLFTGDHLQPPVDLTVVAKCKCDCLSAHLKHKNVFSYLL